MISIEWNKSSLKKFYSKMGKIISELPESSSKGVKNALEGVQKLAIQLKPNGKSDKGILIELFDTEKNISKGRVYTDSKNFTYLVYLEFGTGIYADPEGGGSKAKKIPWYVHTSMADLSMYNYQTITFTDENGTENTFYVIYGMKSHPYMRPAGFQSRDSNIEAVEKEISEMIRRVIK
jgi:hypothetical protein